MLRSRARPSAPRLAPTDFPAGQQLADRFGLKYVEADMTNAGCSGGGSRCRVRSTSGFRRITVASEWRRALSGSNPNQVAEKRTERS